MMSSIFFVKAELKFESKAHSVIILHTLKEGVYQMIELKRKQSIISFWTCTGI